MARNGSGTYSNPYSDFVSGTVISSAQVDANNSDIATALTQSIAVDGQSSVTANIPLGANKLTGVAVGSAATDSVNLGQAQAEAMHWCGTAGGSANAITLAPSPAITAYAAGQRFVWKASSNVNTGATTVAISGLGAIALQDNGAALVAGNHAANKIFMGILDTTSTVQIIGVQISGTDPLIVSSLTVSGDALIGDDLTLNSDAAILGFGENTDVTLTHVHDTGLLLNSTRQLQFNDASQYINAPSATVLDVNATDEIELNATLVDVNANLDVSGTSLLTGVTTHGGNVVSDTDSTDDLGTTSVRWKDLFIDSITATDQVTATGFTGTLDGILGSGAAAAATVTTTQINGTATVGVDDTGYDVKFFGAASGSYMLWDESTDDLILGGASKLGIGATTVDADLHIETAAPTIKLEDSDNALSCYINGDNGNALIQSHNANRDIIFGENGASAELMRIMGTGNVGIGKANPAVELDVVGDLTVSGAVSKGSGSFKIQHPLPAKKDTHNLVHSFIEGPQADLIYRGRVTLSGGSATVNIDTSAGMTAGTFEVLCRDVQCFTSNESGWTCVRGSVSGSTLTIEAEANDCTDTISWMVVGERKDQHMIDTDWTDENGKVIVEPEQVEEE